MVASKVLLAVCISFLTALALGIQVCTLTQLILIKQNNSNITFDILFCPLQQHKMTGDVLLGKLPTLHGNKLTPWQQFGTAAVFWHHSNNSTTQYYFTLWYHLDTMVALQHHGSSILTPW